MTVERYRRPWRCRIGLHSYGEWEDTEQTFINTATGYRFMRFGQERRCRDCRHWSVRTVRP